MSVAGLPGYAELKRFLIETTGLAYYRDRDEQLGNLLGRRLVRFGAEDFRAYLAYLIGPEGEAEIEALVCDLTIGETHFFRHRELFDVLRDRVLPGLLDRPSHLPLRVWSAGCSVGAELYSVSILLRRDLAARLGDRPVMLVGTDINVAFLREAEQGRFGDWALRSVSDEIKRDCFRRRAGRWEILPEFRAGVSFRQHNLVSDPLPSDGLFAFDLILCRNVMIYFDATVCERLVRGLHECLVPDGWLAVGHAESGPVRFPGFRALLEPGVVLYRRDDPVPAAPARRPEAPVRRRRRRPRRPPPPRTPDVPAEPWPELRHALDRGLWAEVVARCDRLVERDAFEARAYYYRALALEQLHRLDDAERDLRRALYLDRGHVLAHVHLGRLLERRGRPSEAKPLLRAATRLAENTNAGTAADGELTVAELRELLRIRSAEGSDA